VGEAVGQSHAIQAEVIHVVLEEMAQKMTDVVLRRTDLGTGGYPGEEALHTCADLMSEELGWPLSTREREIEEVKANFPSFRGMVKGEVGI